MIVLRIFIKIFKELNLQFLHIFSQNLLGKFGACFSFHLNLEYRGGDQPNPLWICA